jgi:hypothetical protein
MRKTKQKVAKKKKEKMKEDEKIRCGIPKVRWFLRVARAHTLSMFVVLCWNFALCM